MKLIKNVRLVLKDKIVRGEILFSEKIEKIIYRQKEADLAGINDNLPNIEIIDGKGNYLCPGFIDIHIHGAAGFDTMDASSEALKTIKKSLIKSGVTSFLATTMSMPISDIEKTLSVIRNEMIEDSQGARIIGSHLEGPFLNKEYKGCHLAKDIILPNTNLIEKYQDIIKLLTIAPEIEGAEAFIKYLREKDIIVSAGHTAASYEEVMEARKWGLSHTTHLFNAMGKLHHRKPSLLGAALTTDMTCELIADFIHLHPATIKIVLQAKELGQLILVTDQMKAGSLGNGEYDLGGQKVIVKDGAASLVDGQLAGSVLRLDQAIRNIKKISDLPLEKIINMVTYNPARLLGMEDQLGCLKEGNRADFVFLNQDLEVIDVFKDGKLEDNN